MATRLNIPRPPKAVLLGTFWLVYIFAFIHFAGPLSTKEEATETMRILQCNMELRARVDNGEITVETAQEMACPKNR